MLSRTPRAWVVRSCALLASAALVIVSVPGSAVADDPKSYVGADFRVSAVAIGVGEATEGKTAPLHVYAYGTARPLPQHVSVHIDAAGTANILVTKVIGDKCSVSSTVTTCDVALLDGGDPDGEL